MQQQSDALFAWQLTDIARKMYVLISIGNNRFYLSKTTIYLIVKVPVVGNTADTPNPPGLLPF